MFWVISVYFNIRNTLPKSGTFLLGHSVFVYYCSLSTTGFHLKILDRKLFPKLVTGTERNYMCAVFPLSRAADEVVPQLELSSENASWKLEFFLVVLNFIVPFN